MSSGRRRARAIVIGIIGFLAAYMTLALLGNLVLAGRTVGRGQIDLFANVLFFVIAGVSAAAGGAIAASLDLSHWTSGALIVGAVAASYFVLTYRSGAPL